ncbi:hypothetical protein AAMO2058_000529100 [Amorphochlora amoebiformis]
MLATRPLVHEVVDRIVYQRYQDLGNAPITPRDVLVATKVLQKLDPTGDCMLLLALHKSMVKAGLEGQRRKGSAAYKSLEQELSQEISRLSCIPLSRITSKRHVGTWEVKETQQEDEKRYLKDTTPLSIQETPFAQADSSKVSEPTKFKHVGDQTVMDDKSVTDSSVGRLLEKTLDLTLKNHSLFSGSDNLSLDDNSDLKARNSLRERNSFALPATQRTSLSIPRSSFIIPEAQRNLGSFCSTPFEITPGRESHDNVSMAKAEFSRADFSTLTTPRTRSGPSASGRRASPPQTWSRYRPLATSVKRATIPNPSSPINTPEKKGTDTTKLSIPAGNLDKGSQDASPVMVNTQEYMQARSYFRRRRS